MAEVVVSLLLPKLTSLLENEVALLRSVPEEFEDMRYELQQMSDFLRAADSAEQSNQQLDEWIRQVINVAYDAEDVIDDYMLQLGGHGPPPAFLHSLHKTCCFPNALMSRHKIASSIRTIRRKINMRYKDYKRLRGVTALRDAAGSTSIGRSWLDPRANALFLEKGDLVSIEGPKTTLINWLLQVGPRRKELAVFGMGGLGKTTLVKQVYDSEAVKEQFTIHAWITVTQSFNIKDLLKDMVQQLFGVIEKPVPERVDSMDGTSLRETIRNLLQFERYLIVLDDIWGANVWEAITGALPNNDYGSWVMLTTRLEDVAKSCCRDPNSKVYGMKPLPLDESWTLFCNKTFQGDPCPLHLEGICRTILTRCEGLPLAISAVSGVLATKYRRNVEEWDHISRGLPAILNDGGEPIVSLKKVLLFSFGHLPFYLKSCFLYLSLFPDDHLIGHTRLIRLWIAEGFIQTREEKTLEDVAEEYLRVLLYSGLIQVAGRTSYGNPKNYRMHKVYQEIILTKSRSQNFAAVATEQGNMQLHRVRRLSVCNWPEDGVQGANFQLLRALLMFEMTPSAAESFMHTLLRSKYKLLRVLDLQGAPIHKFPTQILDLFHLRYLSLRDTEVKEIPESIGKLQNLETLNLKHTRVSKLPAGIRKLRRLRNLLVYRHDVVSYAHDRIKYGFRAMKEIRHLRSLQKLSFIEANKDCNDIILMLGKLTQLRRLGIIDTERDAGSALCSSIERLSELRALSITSKDENEIIDLQELSSPPPYLQRLYLTGHLLELPGWISSLHNLKRLYLKRSGLFSDPLAVLQGLPNLVHLELLQAYRGERLCFKSGGFKKLKILGFDEFDNLSTLEFETDTMPCLKTLIITRCEKLREVPLGITRLKKLKVLGFYDMPDELIEKLQLNEEVEDPLTFATIPLIYACRWRNGSWDTQIISKRGSSESQPIISQAHLIRLK